MPLERTPLAPDELPASIAPFFAEGVKAGQTMLLARGLAPGLGAADLVTGLYQAACHDNTKIVEAAVKSARELPDAILDGALSAQLDPHVLDFFSGLVQSKPEKLQRILLNPFAADDTVADLARVQSQDMLLEIIAKNEQRLLRTPEIIKALYLNPATRMSTANRCLELAVRNQVVVDIPAYKEIAQALGAEKKYDDPMDQALADAEADAAFQGVHDAKAAGEDGEIPDDEALENEEELRKRTSLLGLTLSQKVRLAHVGSGYQRALLLRDPNRVVAMAAIKSPLVKETEVIRVSQSRSVNDDVIRHIATNRDWLKIHQIKVALVANPKCPLPTSMRLLPHMRLVELRNLARSKNISSALRTAAKHLLSKKG
jgi:hypothetical protein